MFLNAPLYVRGIFTYCELPKSPIPGITQSIDFISERRAMVKPIRITYTASGGVLTNTDGTHILLLIRPARDEVRLPKGHMEPEESAMNAALREVAEETGYDDIEIIADLGEQLVAFPLGDKVVRRTEHYFLMRARSLHQTERPDLDEHQFFTIWVPWDEVITHLTFEAEHEWIRRARRIIERNT